MLTEQIGNVAVETKCDYFLSLKNTIRREKGKYAHATHSGNHTHTYKHIYT